MDNLPKIKFCGMSQKDDIDAAIKLKVNWIGIIYVYSSHRYVDFAASDLIIDQYKDLIDFVGVFVNADDNLLKRAVKSGINAIQLHGDETPERCMEVKSNFNLPIIKAFPISEQEDLDKISRIGTTLDDSVGEAFDKASIILETQSTLSFNSTCFCNDTLLS